MERTMNAAGARSFGLLPAAFVLAAFALANAATSDAADVGTLRGQVRYDGPPPERPIITMSADPACDKMFPKGRPVENILVAEGGGLANVIVYVKSGLPEDYRAPAPTGSPVIDQKGCAYSPHVSAVRTGQEIEFRNSDATFHNVDARAKLNPAFNEAMPLQNQVLRKAFATPEVAVKLKCDIHPWMSGYVGVFPHPFFAVTGADGSFTIPDVPEGDYVVEAWHETLGGKSQAVSVDEKKGATAEFRFAGN